MSMVPPARSMRVGAEVTIFTKIDYRTGRSHFPVLGSLFVLRSGFGVRSKCPSAHHRRRRHRASLADTDGELTGRNSAPRTPNCALRTEHEHEPGSENTEV